MRVEDAHGQPPDDAVLARRGARPQRRTVARRVSRVAGRALTRGCPADDRAEGDSTRAIAWLDRRYELPRSAARTDRRVPRAKESALWASCRRSDRIVLERFFDEAGGMQLVMHAPFGGRINRAWGLALRKRFCRTFDFELQAAATEDGIVHLARAAAQFPLEDVFRYVHPNTVRETLVQAVLDAPMFETRWRWTTTLALAVPRSRRWQAACPGRSSACMRRTSCAAVFPDAARLHREHPGRARGAAIIRS